MLRWYPAKILALSEVPSYFSNLSQNSESGLFVLRYGFLDIKLVPVSRLSMLAQNKLDRERASKTPEIRDAYDQAVSDLRDDY